MPLVWEALSLQPIGHQVELGGIRGMFRMQGCRLRLTIRSAQEEDALRRILEILGYRHARYRQLNQVFIRRDFPIADPRQALRELMEPMTEGLDLQTSTITFFASSRWDVHRIACQKLMLDFTQTWLISTDPVAEELLQEGKYRQRHGEERCIL